MHTTRNIYINLLPIKTGGGLQVALSFVQNSTERRNSLVFIVNKGSVLESACADRKLSYISINDRRYSRFMFEYIHLPRLLHNTPNSRLYTLFGPGVKVRGVVSIVGSAYSNIFFPEIDFWEVSGLQRLKKKVIDYYRLRQTLKCDGIIFENAAMRARATSLFGVERNNTIYIRPSISSYAPVRTNIYDKPDGSFDVLLLTSWHPNKNLQILPEVLSNLDMLGVRSIRFVVSIDSRIPPIQDILRDASERGVAELIEFVGPIHQPYVSTIYGQVDAVALLSKLESFSNNIIEAYHFGKPLLVSDLEWSRSICGDAPVYVDRLDADDIANQLIRLSTDADFYHRVIQRQREELLKYPSPEEKVDLQLEFIMECECAT